MVVIQGLIILFSLKHIKNTFLILPTNKNYKMANL